MSAQFDTAVPYADGFETHYINEIQPALAAMEVRRKKAVTIVVLCGLGVVAGFACFMGGDFLAARTGLNRDAIMFAGFALLMASILAGFITYRRVHGAFKEVLVGRTCAFLDLDYQSRRFAFPFERFEDVHLLPNHDKRKLEDRIAGEHDGVSFQLCEAVLKRQDNSSDDSSDDNTVFRGLILIYQFPKRFSGETIVVPDATWLGNMVSGMTRSGERVTLEDPRFEKQFEVYSSDQVEARYILTPRFMERLVELAEHVGKPRGLSFAFNGSDLLIAVRSEEDHFEGGGIFKSFAERERAAELLKELGLLFQIVDVLNLSNRSGA